MMSDDCFTVDLVFDRDELIKALQASDKRSFRVAVVVSNSGPNTKYKAKVTGAHDDLEFIVAAMPGDYTLEPWWRGE